MRFKPSEINVADVDMTPMIDIVFQLLTFFMIVTNFENTKADERVKLPDHSTAKPPLVAREKELVLNVGFLRNEKGEKTNPDALLFYASEDVPVLESAPILQREKRMYRDLGVDLKDVTVVVRADHDVPTGDIQELIKLCQEQTDGNTGGFSKFALKAKSEAGD